MSLGYGPHRTPRAIVLTFDNLGEASALERGTWTPDTPLGEDPSVTAALPRLLDALDDSRLSATFFVEGVNAELNPEALSEIAGRGHEVGAHGWRHEQWGELSADPSQERELLERATRALTERGLAVAGFRPPGGELTAQTMDLLRELGYQWCSPAARDSRGATPSVQVGLRVIPFAWELVDAYHLMERFADLRVGRGAPAQPLDTTAAGERLGQAVTEGDGVQTIVLHPFLMVADAWFEQVQRLLGLVAGLRDAGQAWVVPGRELTPQ
ncbi:MAG TPA: polysaccharide deacetylase family protein [Solirubrobacteraceae bacterium]|nr:polysaccharide deacetylase family protein [Solirubrobacteraceae bacterium]